MTMIKIMENGVILNPQGEQMEFHPELVSKYLQHTMAYQVMREHNQWESMELLKLKFDALVSPDNNYVSVLQTAAACGLKKFPVPYILSNCHNTLCAVGGTISEDDHVFGLGNAKKYGGEFIPPHKAVIHQYMREMMAGCGKMILGSDSHTRYGALGTLAVGEGGGEIVKQLLSQTYDIKRPKVIAVKLTGTLRPGVGPMDVALSIIGSTFGSGLVKNKILEFVGDGIADLSVEYRMGIDVMMTESGAFSSIWCTDEKVKRYLEVHGRIQDYITMRPKKNAYYNGLIEVHLDEIECMMALPSHPSNVISIREFQENPEAYLELADTKIPMKEKLKNGKLHVNQALVSGCSGGLFENISAIADVLEGCVIDADAIGLGVNPASQPIVSELARHGILERLINEGVTVRPCICGPCFGVTDVPANNQLSIRHVTRNFPNREGAKADKGQNVSSILMDARSIAATVRNGGILTPATDLKIEYRSYEYMYQSEYYEKQIYHGYGQPDSDYTIAKGPNITDWPSFSPVKKHLLLKVCGVYLDSVTTDDLSPSGEAASYRSNPEKLAQYTMINKDASYVEKTKMVMQTNRDIQSQNKLDDFWEETLEQVMLFTGCQKDEITVGSVLCGSSVGEGSSREQAVSSQKILGGYANIALEYVTKRYRTNLINWGILPILSDEVSNLKDGQLLLIRNVENVIDLAGEVFPIQIVNENKQILGNIGEMTREEKEILKEGCLINYNQKHI